MQIYLVPFLLDFILFMVLLRLSDAAGREMHLSNAQTTAFMVAFSLGYMLVCLVIGRVLNARNTRPIMLCSIALIAMLGHTVAFYDYVLAFAVARRRAGRGGRNGLQFFPIVYAR
jgi:MFS family permease